MKAFFANTFVHWFLVTIAGYITFWLSNSPIGALSVSAAFHGAYEYILSYTA